MNDDGIKNFRWSRFLPDGRFVFGGVIRSQVPAGEKYPREFEYRGVHYPAK